VTFLGPSETDDRGARASSATTHVDALVADAGTRQALVSIRELGKAGLAVGAIDADAQAPGLASRWAEVKSVVPGFVEDQHAYVDAVLRFCREHGPASLIPAHDGSIEALRKRRGEVEQLVGLAMAPERALAVAIDKTDTLAFAETIGLRIPRGAFVVESGQAAGAVDEVGLPAVVKPTRSWAQGEGVGQRLVAVVASTREQALAAIERVLAEGIDVVLQEWLPGDREAISFMRANGKTWARFAQRADRTFPPLGGNSVIRESIPMPDDVALGAERLVAELGLDGYSEVEFRRAADGSAALMEINPRLSASVEIAVRSGVPFPRLLHDWASGGELREQVGYRTGLRMRWLGGDLSWLRSVVGQSPGPDVPSTGRAIKMFAADFARPFAYDYADRTDIRPALAAATGAATRMSKLASTTDVAPTDAPSGARTPSARGSTGFDTDTVVIGAGPYGLSVSAHLTGRGVRHETFGDVMSLWAKHMPAGMFLKSEGFASNLGHPDGRYTLGEYCAENETSYEYRDVASPIPLDTFARYGRWFAERAVPHLRDERVEQVSRSGGGYEVRLSNGDTLRAKHVVVASGMSNCAYVPPALGELSPATMVHAYEHRDPETTRGADVAVVGLGQSALESAALMQEHGANVTVFARAPRVQWNSKPGGSDRSLLERWRAPQSGLGENRGLWVYSNLPLAFHLAPRKAKIKRAYKALGPAGAWWLRPRIEEHIPLLLQRTVVSAREQDGGAVLSVQGPDGIEEHGVAHVLAGTGYRPDKDLLQFLDADVRQQIATVPESFQTPALDSSFQSSVPGLYFVGYMAGMSFGPVMRFVYGAEFAAGRVARRLAR
jgi:thioredoxin reductase/predicted ATP-grasp superfamily ATP-dependent carboligase